MTERAMLPTARMAYTTRGNTSHPSCPIRNSLVRKFRQEQNPSRRKKGPRVVALCEGTLVGAPSNVGGLGTERLDCITSRFGHKDGLRPARRLRVRGDVGLGYTPAFSEIYTGTLYGRWPAAAVWASLLPLMDRFGCIDMSPQAIAGMTGWPLDLLERGIAQLMEPDPHSRSPAEEGRRLVLIDPERPWGWRAVNHGRYREKARLINKNASEVDSGRNQGRMSHRNGPPVTAGDRRSPPVTAADPPSDIDLLREETRETRSPDPVEKPEKPERRGSRIPDDFELTPARRLVAEAERLPAERTFTKFVNHWRSAPGTKGRKVDWDKTWHNWCLNETDRTRPPLTAAGSAPAVRNRL